MKILIVEDENGISDFLKQGLEEEGFEVVVSRDGKEALQIFCAIKPDLLLLDWILPGLSGIDICTEIRKFDLKTPILFLSAKDTLQDTIEGLKAGAHDFIKKPFSFEELLLRINLNLKTNLFENNILTLGTIRLDIKSHQVFNNNAIVFFTPREFQLLVFLIKNKENISTRIDIIRGVWKIYYEYDDAVIDVFINSVRRKLNLKKENDYIKTIRGIGYIATENP